ncbi:hypothetical protein C8R45DRAFT_1110492 [Mycena sanguinolenta]|nr:hypothetical protein C8R45DRAFT_1110492 [Mycena sanguinolenta]
MNEQPVQFTAVSDMSVLSDRGTPFSARTRPGTPHPISSDLLYSPVTALFPFPRTLERTKSILSIIPHHRMLEYLEAFWSSHIRAPLQSVYELLGGRSPTDLLTLIVGEIQFSHDLQELFGSVKVAYSQNKKSAEQFYIPGFALMSFAMLEKFVLLFGYSGDHDRRARDDLFELASYLSWYLAYTVNYEISFINRAFLSGMMKHTLRSSRLHSCGIDFPSFAARPTPWNTLLPFSSTEYTVPSTSTEARDTLCGKSARFQARPSKSSDWQEGLEKGEARAWQSYYSANPVFNFLPSFLRCRLVSAGVAPAILFAFSLSFPARAGRPVFWLACRSCHVVHFSRAPGARWLFHASPKSIPAFSTFARFCAQSRRSEQAPDYAAQAEYWREELRSSDADIVLLQSLVQGLESRPVEHVPLPEPYVEQPTPSSPDFSDLEIPASPEEIARAEAQWSADSVAHTGAVLSHARLVCRIEQERAAHVASFEQDFRAGESRRRLQREIDIQQAMDFNHSLDGELPRRRVELQQLVDYSRRAHFELREAMRMVELQAESRVVLAQRLEGVVAADRIRQAFGDADDKPCK